MSVLLNRSTGKNMICINTWNDIKMVAETPHLIFHEQVDPKVGLTSFQCQNCI